MPRSKNYLKLKSLIEPGKTFTLEEAIELVKKTSSKKFDASIEIHGKLGIDPKHSDQQIRTTFILPHGIGKTVKIAVFADLEKQKEAKEAGAHIVGGEELIEEIKKTEKCDFEIAIATPDMMKKMGVIAKILGPKGLMPSPKNETITTDMKKTINELQKGKITIKNDEFSNIHQVIGKASFESNMLFDNAKAFIDTLKNAKPGSSKGTFIKKLVITSTMGPAIPLQV